jgi:hypothetical protein
MGTTFWDTLFIMSQLTLSDPGSFYKEHWQKSLFFVDQLQLQLLEGGERPHCLRIIVICTMNAGHHQIREIMILVVRDDQVEKLIIYWVRRIKRPFMLRG